MHDAAAKPPGSLRALLAAACAAYVGLLWLLRPRTPFEWDEVLFLRALERYDVGTHSPHPPGYPLYVAAGKLLALVVGDPLAALQLLSILAAGAAVALLWRLARQLGLDDATATAAAAVLALAPAFAFNANVPLSDVPSVAATLAAALCLLGAWSDPRRLPAAAVATAAAAGIRPQLVVVLLPLGLAALAAAVRGRHWRRLAAATAAGILTSAAIWIPAIATTGPGRFLAKLDETARWMAIHEADGRIGGAGLEPLLRHWTVVPFVRLALALPFWALVVWGSRRLWRGGRRVAVAVAAGGAVVYLVAALFTLHMSTSVRYVLPALPFLALLAGAVATPGDRRRPRLAILGAWLLAAAALAAPAYLIRARGPAPPWEALEWIASRPVGERRAVIVMDEFLPHARYVLEPAGSEVVDPEPGIPPAPDLAAGEGALLLTRFPVPEAPTLLQRVWPLDEVRLLGRGRYQRATVSRLPRDGSLVFSPDWGRRDAGMELRVAGSISLPDDAAPWSVRFTPDREVAVGRGGDPQPHAAGSPLDLVVLPGSAGALRIDARPGRPTVFTDYRARAFGADGALLVGPVAHADGVGGALWRSDLELRSAASQPSVVALQLLRAGASGHAPEFRLATIPPGGAIRLDDVVGTLFADSGTAFLRLLGEHEGLVAAATTYDARRPETSRVSVAGQRAPAPIPAGGTLRLAGLRAGPTTHSNVGVLNLESRPVSLAARLVASGGATLLEGRLDLGPGELRVFAKALDSTDGRPLRADAVLAPLDGAATLLAWGSVVDTATGRSHLIAARPGP